jgi:uncharacterized repeat protein (TIGR01451 family)
MKSTNVTPISDVAHLHNDNVRTRIPSPGLFVRVGAILILAGLLVGTLYSASSASSLKKTLATKDRTAALSGITSPIQSSAIVRFSDFLPSRVWRSSSLLLSGVSVTTYASDCTTPKTVFNLQDGDLTVCAKVTGADPSWQLIWSNSNFIAVKNDPVSSGTSTFTLTTNSSLGDWRVILFEPFGGTVQALTSFTVIDAQNPRADLSVSKSAISSNASSGAQVLFSIQITNGGPDDATAVQLMEDVPANTTFVSFDQLSGPTFSCISPNAGESGTTICTLSSLARSHSAIFVATYQVDTVSTGTLISNSVGVSSTTADQNNENNSSTATLEVVATHCQLSTPPNITVNADSGQAGAVVTFATPTGAGDCGATTTGENGETIPAISCNPASGSFFPVGTNTVICTAQTGSAVSFQVTVDNPGALSISLNEANPIAVECGTDFNDPGATAIDGTGQSIPVVVTLPQNFNPDAPAVGNYTITYTATEGNNSVSTDRTVNVSDSEAPTITIEGANPYKIQQGSCSPFVDPGASALDGCAGPQPVSSSILGPGGATSVSPNISGSYTVTYTATDGNHQATATRNVLVGSFPEDEVDQPASSNGPPTISLSGDDQIMIECGSNFTDPGAIATLCGSSVPVTTSSTVDTHSPGTYSITYTATANNHSTEATRTVIVQDTVAPIITLNGANPMTIGFGTVFTDPGAAATDGCAGDLTPAISVTGSVNISVAGAYLLTYTVTDPSGHTDIKTRTVNVSPYNFSGFFAPINNLPTLNSMKAGQGAPVKFSLGGNQGVDIFAAESPFSIQINCDTNAPLDDVELTVTAGGSSLNYDSAADRYIYVWKTESAWKNMCRQLNVTLKDGTQHVANFKFK